jgi:hypothetical protein
VRRLRRGHEQNAIELRAIDRRIGGRQVPEVERVERAP